MTVSDGLKKLSDDCERRIEETNDSGEDESDHPAGGGDQLDASRVAMSRSRNHDAGSEVEFRDIVVREL